MEDWRQQYPDAAQARREHRSTDALRILDAAVADCRFDGDRLGLASALVGLGQIEHDLSRRERAIACYTEAAEIYRANVDARLAHTLRHLADLYVEVGRLEDAQHEYDDVLALQRATPPDAIERANTCRGVALLRAAEDDPDGELIAWKEARLLYARNGIAAGVAEADRRIAALTR